ncbi:hypothetical protein ABFV57_07180 [Pseudomonas neuropathica]|jgi:hypothetical protein|uniref:hypothetical protein n=1 Tax=Pseudomonas neuropathica TaxID=2730425 RepID=UPI0034D46A2C
MDGLSGLEIVKIGASSGLVAAIGTHFFQIGRDWWKSKNEAKFCAVKLIAKLEDYGLQCASSVENNRKIFPDEVDFKTAAACPIPPQTWSDDKIEALDAGAASKIFWLSTEITLAYQNIHSTAAKSYPEEFDPRDYLYDHLCVVGYFGYKALILADDLRRRYGLPGLIAEWSLEAKKAELKYYWEQAKKQAK